MSTNSSNMDDPKLSMSIRKRHKSIKHKLSKIQNIESLLRENKPINDNQRELLSQKEKLLILNDEYDNIYKLDEINDSAQDDELNKYITLIIELYFIFITHQSVNQHHISNFLSYFIVKNQENKQSYVNRIINFINGYTKGEGEFCSNISYQSLRDLFNKIESPPTSYSSLLAPLFDCSRSDMATMATTSQDSRSIHSDQIEDNDNCSATTPTTNMCGDISGKSDQYENSAIITNIIDHHNSLSSKSHRNNNSNSNHQNTSPNPIQNNIQLSRQQPTKAETHFNQNAATHQNIQDHSNNNTHSQDTRPKEDIQIIADKPRGPWNTDFSRELPPQVRNPTKNSPADHNHNNRHYNHKISDPVKPHQDNANSNNINQSNSTDQTNNVNQGNSDAGNTTDNNNNNNNNDNGGNSNENNNNNNNPYFQKPRRNNGYRNRFRDNQYPPNNRERYNWKYNQSNTTQDNINNAINTETHNNKEGQNNNNTHMSAPSDSQQYNRRNNQNFNKRNNFNRRGGGGRRGGFGPGPRRHAPPTRKIDMNNDDWQPIGTVIPDETQITEPVN